MSSDRVVGAWRAFRAPAGGVARPATEAQYTELIDHGNLSRILSGERGISKALLRRLVEHFGVAVDMFL